MARGRSLRALAQMLFQLSGGSLVLLQLGETERRSYQMETSNHLDLISGKDLTPFSFTVFRDFPDARVEVTDEHKHALCATSGLQAG